MTESENNNNFYMVVTNIDMPFGGRVILDIIYNNNDEIAICILKAKNKFECYPNISNQNPDDTFSISLSRKFKPSLKKELNSSLDNFVIGILSFILTDLCFS